MVNQPSFSFPYLLLTISSVLSSEQFVGYYHFNIGVILFQGTVYRTLQHIFPVERRYDNAYKRMSISFAGRAKLCFFQYKRNLSFLQFRSQFIQRVSMPIHLVRCSAFKNFFTYFTYGEYAINSSFEIIFHGHRVFAANCPFLHPFRTSTSLPAIRLPQKAIITPSSAGDQGEAKLLLVIDLTRDVPQSFGHGLSILNLTSFAGWQITVSTVRQNLHWL